MGLCCMYANCGNRQNERPQTCIKLTKLDSACQSQPTSYHGQGDPQCNQNHNNYHQQQNKKASKFPTREGCLLGGPPSNMVGSMGKMSVPLYDPWDSVFGLKRGSSEKDLWNKIVFLKFNKTQYEYVLTRKLLLEIQKLTRHRHKASFEDGAYRIR